MATDPTYSNAKVHMNGPDLMTVESSGVVEFLAGSELKLLDSTALAATTLEINRNCDASGRIVTWATNTLAVTEALHDGKTIVMSYTASPLVACTATLPAATGSGARFKFVVGSVNTSNYVIKVTTTDIIQGSITSLQDSADTVVGWETAGTSDTITLNGTTTGGVNVGDCIELEDIASATWAVSGRTVSSGTEATPFSAAVS